MAATAASARCAHCWRLMYAPVDALSNRSLPSLDSSAPCRVGRGRGWRPAVLAVQRLRRIYTEAAVRRRGFYSTCPSTWAAPLEGSLPRMRAVCSARPHAPHTRHRQPAGIIPDQPPTPAAAAAAAAAAAPRARRLTRSAPCSAELTRPRMSASRPALSMSARIAARFAFSSLMLQGVGPRRVVGACNRPGAPQAFAVSIAARFAFSSSMLRRARSSARSGRVGGWWCARVCLCAGHVERWLPAACHCTLCVRIRLSARPTAPIAASMHHFCAPTHPPTNSKHSCLPPHLSTQAIGSTVQPSFCSSRSLADLAPGVSLETYLRGGARWGEWNNV